MKAKLTWRKQPNERGLARTCQRERGYDLRFGGEEVASVRPRYVGFSRVVGGYYWSARHDELGIPLRNTAQTPVATIEQAKADCRAYVSAHLKAASYWSDNNA